MAMNIDNNNNYKPFIAPDKVIPEITLKVLVLSIILTLILAVSNAYLALKIGILISASIPAAILSMGVLRLFRRANILENNLVQTAASAGEAVAGGVVYTAPALIIIHYWSGFSYWQTFFIALCGSVIGILFSIPLRRVLMTAKHLRYPEGVAIAEVLQLGEVTGTGLKEIMFGGIVGATIEFLQTGVKIVASSIQLWFNPARLLFGFTAGFSATMIGAGYLIGFDVAASIFIGAVIGWIIGIPILNEVYSHHLVAADPIKMVVILWSTKVRYIGIGAMLVAGVWTLLTLFKPFYQSIKQSFNLFQKRSAKQGFYQIARTERDMPILYVLMGVVLMLLITFFLFIKIMPNLGLTYSNIVLLSLFWILFICLIGFIFSAITGYFSGLVGVTASPGSAVVIAGLLITSLLVYTLLWLFHGTRLSEQMLHDGAAMAIIVVSILTGIAAIANDNIQDLKVGHLVGATPWKQQMMLLLGAMISVIIIPPVMQLLFQVYGIADVLPHVGMDPTEALPAPPAALMAALAQGVFHGSLPWSMLLVGAIIGIVLIVSQRWFTNQGLNISVLAVAIGIYLPIATTTPIFIGGLIEYIIKRKRVKLRGDSTLSELHVDKARQRGLLLACGLVVGATLMDVVLAVPFAIAGSPDVLKINIPRWHLAAEGLGLLLTIALGVWFYRTVIGVARTGRD